MYGLTHKDPVVVCVEEDELAEPVARGLEMEKQYLGQSEASTLLASEP
jgi:hypothetical protein